jgi:glycosyltransferase involved in cell wall biosynthesis
MRVLIIIPAYNEEKNIEALLDNLEKNYSEYDYLVVNDCSRDSTPNILKGRGASFLDLPVNLGIGGGVQSGYIYAKENGYDIAVQMDGDGQHLPEYLKDIITPVAEGEADACVGSRFIKCEGFQSSAMRRLGINILSFLIRILTGQKVTDVTSGFRAVNRDVIELFASEYAQDYPEPEALVVSAVNGFKTIEVPVKMQERLGGTSSINGFKSVYYMIKVSLSIIVSKLSGRRKK